MTKEEFESAVAGCGMPCWVTLLTGEQISCSALVLVTKDFVVFETEEAQRVVRLADIESIGAEKRKGAKAKRSNVFPPRRDEG